MGNLANLIIIGAQKCGTTTLYYSLRHHSDISPAVDPYKNMLVKEVDFFFDANKWEQGIDWYKAHYKSDSPVYMDASPNYLTDPLIYKRILEVCPGAKLIVCLRNPIDRAYSQYNHYRQDMPASESWDWDSTLSFEENVKQELNDNLNLKTDFMYFLRKGLYIEQMELLIKYFDRAQIHITIMDWWHSNYESELKKVMLFLGVKVQDLPLLPRHYRHYTVEPLRVEVRKQLSDFYRPYNKRLFEFLKFEIPEWEE